MKINELNTFQNLARGLAGTAASATEPTNTQGVGAARSRAKKSGLSVEDQLAQDTFVQRFVSRGANALNTAISQGLVDTTSTDLGPANAQPQSPPAGSGTTPGAAAPAGTATPAPSSTAGGTAPAAQPTSGGAAPAAGSTAPAAPGSKVKAPGNAAVPTGQKQGAVKPAIDLNVDRIVSGMRKLVPSGTKPLPPESKIAQEITKDLPNVALNKDYLVRVGDKILKANNAGYDVKDLHRQFMAQYAKGNKQKTISEDRLQEIYNKLTSVERFRNALKKSGYDPDLAVKRIKALIAKQKKEREDRDRYLKTDEGIMDKIKGVFKRGGQQPAAGAAPGAAAAPAAPSGKPSMGSWFRDNFMKGFLRGINLGTSQQQIDDILKRMPQSLQNKSLNKDLTDIANIAWAVSDQGRKQDTQP